MSIAARWSVGQRLSGLVDLQHRIADAVAVLPDAVADGQHLNEAYVGVEKARQKPSQPGFSAVGELSPADR